MLHAVVRDYLEDFLRAAADRGDGIGVPCFVEAEFRHWVLTAARPRHRRRGSDRRYRSARRGIAGTRRPQQNAVSDEAARPEELGQGAVPEVWAGAFFAVELSLTRWPWLY